MGDIFCRFLGLCDAPTDRIDRLGQMLVNMPKGFLISVMYTAEQIPTDPVDLSHSLVTLLSYPMTNEKRSFFAIAIILLYYFIYSEEGPGVISGAN